MVTAPRLSNGPVLVGIAAVVAVVLAAVALGLADDNPIAETSQDPSDGGGPVRVSLTTNDHGVDQWWHETIVQSAMPSPGGTALGKRVDPPSDAELLGRVDDASRQFGISVRSAEVLYPSGSALSVSFVVPDDPRPDWTIDQLRTALVGTTPDVDGALISLVTTDGDELLVAGTAYRSGEGGLWFAPGQDERFGAVHGGLADVE
jgi:hypothetical protein